MKQGIQSWCSETTQSDGFEEGGGKWMQDGGNMCTRGWFTSMYSKNHHSIVK